MNYVNNSQLWSGREISDLVKASTRIIKISENRFQFSPKVMLDSNGQPINMELFMVLSGLRVMLTPIVKPFITVEEYQEKVLIRNKWNNSHKNYKCVKTNTFRNISLAIEMAKSVNK